MAIPASAPRWPRTLAGITAYQSCLQYPFTSVPLSGGTPGTQASRLCDRAGRWEPGDYSHCLYTNDITRVLYTFVLVRPGQGVAGTPSALVSGTGRGEASQLLLCSLGGHREGLLLFSSSPSSRGFRPPRPHSESASHPSIFIPQHSKGSLNGGRKDSMSQPLCFSQWPRSGLPAVLIRPSRWARPSPQALP